MPVKNKVILTCMVFIICGAVALYEYNIENFKYFWILIIIMFLMVLGLWVFPEAKGKVGTKE